MTGDIMALQIISLLIALAAVFVGPLVQVRIARQSIRAQVRSSNRMEWIGTFRRTLTDYLSLCTRIVRLRTHFLDAKKAGKQVEPPDISKELEEADKIFTGIRLLLKPGGEEETQLLNKLAEFSSFLEITTEQEFREYSDAREEVVRRARAILKTEWERVKRLE